MQSPNSDVLSKVGTTPTKQKNSEITKGSPVVAELQITLTPTSKLKEALLERSAEKFEDNSVKNGDKLEASRTLFSSEQETTKVADEVNISECISAPLPCQTKIEAASFTDFSVQSTCPRLDTIDLNILILI